MNRVDGIFLLLAFWIYLVSFVLFSLFGSLKRRSIGSLAMVIFSAAICCHSVSVATRWAFTGHPPLATMFEFAVTMSLASAVICLVAILRYRRTELGVPLSALLVAILGASSLLPSEPSESLMPALQSYWFYIHVTLAALAEGAFIVATAAAVLYLFALRKSSKIRESYEIAVLEEVVLRSILIGYPLFTVGALFAGAVWAHYAWGSFWSWDPKETGSLVVWLFYTLLLHQNARGSWKGKKLAFATILGFLLALCSFLGNLVFGGLHSYI